MDLAAFIQHRRPEWRQLEEVLGRVEGSGLRSLDDEQAMEFGRLYRRAASDLNQAQTFVSGDATVQYLNDLVARAYLLIYGKSRIDVWGLLRYFLLGYPAVFRRHLRPFLVATTMVLAGAVFGFLAMLYDAQIAEAYLLPSQMADNSIRPGREGEALSTGNLAQLTFLYFVNNTSVSLIAFAGGISFGIVTAWLMFTTGIMLGVLAEVFYQAGQLRSFGAEVLPHGMLEMPAVIIAGAAGFVLAQGMLRARPWPRLEELAHCGKQALFLVAGCVPLMATAGILEAVVARAPQGYLPNEFKLTVAGIVGLLFLSYLLLLGRRKGVVPEEGPRASP